MGTSHYPAPFQTSLVLNTPLHQNTTGPLDWGSFSDGGNRMVGWNLGVLLALGAGHAELWVTLVNRVHAWPISPDQLRRIRHVHDVMIPGFSLAVLLGLGIGGPRLLRGGTWGELAIGWYPFLAASAVGVVGGLYGMLRFHWTRNCPIQASEAREVSVIRSPDGSLPLGHGPFERLARLPFNEQFQVELSRKKYLHPGLPLAFSGLKILHLSDWHFEGTITRDYFEQVSAIAAREAVDLVTFTGDLLDNDACLKWLPTTLGQFSAPLGCWFILGNHDWYLDAAEARRQLATLGWKDATVGPTAIPWRGGTLQMGGDETPWMGSAAVFPERGHPAAESGPEFRILLSHSPDNLSRAKQMGVDLMLSGHNHGGQVILPVIGPVFSPSRYGCRYAGGSFWESPTLLHVSRGLAGRHPLRWRCPPEITVVELERS